MPDAAEAAELRMLQARAYGRGGGLTPAEAERLRVLEAARRVPAGGGGSGNGGPGADGVQPGGAGSREGSLPVDEGTWPSVYARSAGEPPAGAPAGPVRMPEDHARDDGDPGPPVPESVSAFLRRHVLAVAAVAVVLLAAGAALGGLLFGRWGLPAAPLTAEQQGWQAEVLAEGRYDSGSLRALAVQEDVVVWFATQAEGDRVCLVLGDGETIVPTCESRANLRYGVYASISVPDGEQMRAVTAQLLLDVNGEPAVAVDSYLQDERVSGTIEYANEDETRFAADLVAEGFDENIWAVGYDGAVPFWTATRGGEHCLISGIQVASMEIACLERDVFWEGETALAVEYDDPETGGRNRAELVSNNGPQYFVITKGVAAG